MTTKRFAEYIENVKLHGIEFFEIAFDMFDSWVALHPDEVEQYERRSF